MPKFDQAWVYDPATGEEYRLSPWTEAEQAEAEAWAARIYESVIQPANVDFLLWALCEGHTVPGTFTDDEWAEARRRFVAGEQPSVAGSK